MAISSVTVVQVAPEFSAEDVNRINAFIAYAEPYINRTVWGNKSDHAHALMTAHFLASSPSNGAANGGPTQSDKVGDLATTYAVMPAKNDSLETSPYGRLLIQLRRTLLISPIVIT